MRAPRSQDRESLENIGNARLATERSSIAVNDRAVRFQHGTFVPCTASVTQIGHRPITVASAAAGRDAHAFCDVALFPI